MPVDRDRARELFLHAVGKLPPGEWDAYVANASQGDVELERALAEMLRVHREAGSFLERPALGATGLFAPTSTEAPGEQEPPGTLIGPYKIIEAIGEGGMGAVYLAQQTEPVKRLVALKVIKAGMDSKQVLARFEAERQALALMDHPNIAKVHDAGTTQDGRPFFIMELVKGTPITQFCDERKLTTRERLELFVPVCHAIQHAHQKGIIHRDIKPSNVLVALHDEKPVPKVIDFGVAKAVGQQLTEKTFYTNFGTLVGTPAYMAPEQATFNQLDIDTRADIYSLGVLLYELLAGSPPFEPERLKKAALDEVLRLVREEEPPRPSQRLSTSDTKASIAAVRQSEPSRLTKLLRGELDWVVMKALDKERNRRYETANGFAMDVQRYLAGEAVQAVPPSAGYRLRKFARRNRRSLVTAAVLAVALLAAAGAVAGSLGWASRDRAARQTAVEQEARGALEESMRFMEQDKWPEALAAVKRAEGWLAGGGSDELRVRVLQFRKDLELILRLEDIGLLAANVKDGRLNWDAVDDGYAKAFNDHGINVLDLPVEEAAARIRARGQLAIPLAVMLDDWSSLRSSRDEASRARLRAVAGAVDPDPWRRQVREAVQKGDGKALAKLAGAPDLPQQSRNSLVVLWHGLKSQGESETALDILQLVQRLYPGDFWVNYWLATEIRPTVDGRQWATSFAMVVVALRPNYAAAHETLGHQLWRQYKFDEAEVSCRKAIELDPNNSWSHNVLGNVHYMRREYDKAFACYQKSIDLDPNSAAAHSNLGNVYLTQGKWEQAVACHRKAIELNPGYAQPHNNLGKALSVQGKLDEAIACHRKAIELDPKNAAAHNHLGIALSNQVKQDEAIACYRKAIELDPGDALAHSNLGIALSKQGNLEGAITCYRKAIELNPRSAASHNNLGTALSRLGKWDEAIACYRKAIEIDPKYAGFHYRLGALLCDYKHDYDGAAAAFRKVIELNPKYAYAHSGLGNALSAQGKPEEAIDCYRKAIELDPKWGAAHDSLGIALHSQNKRDEAIACYRKAIELDPKTAAPHAHLGIALLQLKQPDEAEAAYRKAIELDPKNVAAYSGLGAILCDVRSDYGGAVGYFRKAVELDPKNSIDLGNLGRALSKQGLIAEAIACYRKAIDLDPKLPGASNRLAWLLATCAEPKFRDPAQAVKLALQATDQDPKNAAFWGTLGTAYYRAGEWDKATTALEKALRLSKPDGGAMAFEGLFLAMAHWQLGDKSEACRWYDKAVAWMVQNQPENEELRRFRAEAEELMGVGGAIELAPAPRQKK